MGAPVLDGSHSPAACSHRDSHDLGWRCRVPKYTAAAFAWRVFGRALAAAHVLKNGWSRLYPGTVLIVRRNASLSEHVRARGTVSGHTAVHTRTRATRTAPAGHPTCVGELDLEHVWRRGGGAADHRQPVLARLGRAIEALRRHLPPPRTLRNGSQRLHNGCVTAMQWLCNHSAPAVQRLCNGCVTALQRLCNGYATAM